MRKLLARLNLAVVVILAAFLLYLMAAVKKPSSALAPLLIAVTGLGLFQWWLQKEPSDGMGKRPSRPRPPEEVINPIHPLITPPATSGRPAPAPRRTIDAVRQLMGDPPRTFDPALAAYLHVDPPHWLDPREDPELCRVYERQSEIRWSGPVVWAAIVQANSMMFKQGPWDHGSSVIYSEDRWFDSQPMVLQQIAHSLFDLKGTDPDDVEAATFARVITNERMRAPKLKIPSSMTGGRLVYHSTLMLSRKQLPAGYLTGGVLPVWVDPADDGTILLVPAAYWPPSLLNMWDKD